MTNRIKQAWLALRGRLEPQVRIVTERVEFPVFGKAVEVTLYEAVDPRWEYFIRSPYALVPPPDGKAEWHGRVFATCEHAFSECSGAKVKSYTVWLIDGKYYKSPELETVNVQPKPKRAKGIPAESLGRAE